MLLLKTNPPGFSADFWRTGPSSLPSLNSPSCLCRAVWAILCCPVSHWTGAPGPGAGCSQWSWGSLGWPQQGPGSWPPAELQPQALGWPELRQVCPGSSINSLNPALRNCCSRLLSFTCGQGSRPLAWNVLEEAASLQRNRNSYPCPPQSLSLQDSQLLISSHKARTTENLRSKFSPPSPLELTTKCHGNTSFVKADYYKAEILG